MTKVLAVVGLGLVAAGAVQAGCPPVTDPRNWPYTYQSPAAAGDEALAVAVDGSNDVVEAGIENRADLGLGLNWLVRKLGPDGTLLWARTHDGAVTGAAANGVAVDGAGNVVAAGYETTATHGRDWFITEYDPSGNVLWTASYDGANGMDDQAAAVAVDGFNNVYVAGTVGTKAENDNWLVRAYDPAGVVLWSRTLDVAANDRALGIAVGPGGTSLVTGCSNCGTASANLEVRAYAPDGSDLWQNTYAGPGGGDDAGAAVAADATGGGLVAGHTYSAGTTHWVWVVRRYAAGGAVSWTTTTAGAGTADSAATAAAMFPDGRAVVGGYDDAGPAGHDWLIREYASNGAILWSQPERGGSPSQANGVAIDGGGGIVAVGATTFAGSASDAWIARRYADVPCLVSALFAAPSTPAAGAVIGWPIGVTLTVTNTGSATAYAVGPARLSATLVQPTFVGVFAGPAGAPLTLAPGQAASVVWTCTIFGTGSSFLGGFLPYTETVTGVRLNLPSLPGSTVLTAAPAGLDAATVTVFPATGETGATVGRVVTIDNRVVNTGGAPLVNVVGTLSVSSGSVYITAPVPAGATALASLAAGTTTHFIWSVIVNSPGTVIFTTVVAAKDANNQTYSGAAIASLVSGGTAGLASSLTVTPNPAVAVPTLTAILSIANPGASGATVTVASLTPSAPPVLVSLRTQPANLPGPAHPVYLGPGAAASFTWTYEPVGSGSETFTASVTAVALAAPSATVTGVAATMFVASAQTVSITVLADAMNTNLPPAGKMQIRQNIINVIRGKPAWILVHGTQPGGQADLTIWTRAGIPLGPVPGSPVTLDGNGVGYLSFDGRLGGRTLASGFYWVVASGALKDRAQVVMINGQ